MEWLQSIRKSVEYIEDHLENVDIESLCRNIYMSPFYLQKGFKVMTGYSISEYIRNRRLYLAALDLCVGSEKIIDIAYKYSYSTPESFTKAFTRFHGVTPSEVKNNSKKINVFLPLHIVINISGGSSMDYRVEKMDSFKVIGFSKQFDMETSSKAIPEFWTEVQEKYVSSWWPNKKPTTEQEIALKENGIGMFGICLEGGTEKNFTYMIAGYYKGGKVPEGLNVVEVPSRTWAKFSCTGAMPAAIQSVNTKIFKEWLPGNPDWNIDDGYNIEWYSPEGNQQDNDYKSEVWICVKPKK